MPKADQCVELLQGPDSLYERHRMRAEIYARVSTPDQDPGAQLDALRSFGTARGWTLTEFVDHGLSGAKERRLALDVLLTAARRREVDVVAVTRLVGFGAF